MIDLKWLYQNSKEGVANSKIYKKNLIDRGMSGDEVNLLLMLDKKRKLSIHNFESKKSEQKKSSQDFAKIKEKGLISKDLLLKMKNLSKDVKNLELLTQQAQDKINEILQILPNRLDKNIPIGRSEEDNVVLHEWGKKKVYKFKAKEHWQLGESNGTIDFDRAGKISGSRFAFLRGQGAKLERALIQFMLDKHVQEHGYEEIFPPLIVNSKALFGTSNFPKFREDVFKIKGRDGYLIPTAEVPLTNLYAGEILKEEDLPKKFTAYTPCFRSEAGSYGQDTKGLIRQHQFNKVEIVKLTHPDKSEEEHLKLLKDAESILQDLNLHYQTRQLCSGDISFGAMKCFDINVWLPGQQAYREISSCSNFGDFQARRANIRFKPFNGGKPLLIHTLNGSGLAVGRTMVAVYENYQQEDGSIIVPEVLKKYMGKEIIK